jgi:hypothetical protein
MRFQKMRALLMSWIRATTEENLPQKVNKRGSLPQKASKKGENHLQRLSKRGENHLLKLNPIENLQSQIVKRRWCLLRLK